MSDSPKKTLSIIGGGAAALYLAAHLDSNKYEITIYEKNKALGRKFLVAGKGGFNLTHSEGVEVLIARYTPPGFLSQSISQLDNQSLITWLSEINIPTYKGSSNRIFPTKGMKPIEVLQRFLDRLESKGVKILTEHTWAGWSKKGRTIFDNDLELKSDIVVFALGGASWKVTGSDGGWLPHFHRQGIKIRPFQASNCNHKVAWPEAFAEKHQGQPLKNISARIKEKICKGELVITETGIEGNALYALSPEVRQELQAHKKATIYLDLKPTLTQEQVFLKLERSTKNTTEILRRDLKLSPVMLAMVKGLVSKEVYMNKTALSKQLKNLPLELQGPGPIDAAISTVGGIALEEVDENFQLRKLPNHYCIGEMLDWDAPTGGYLLQGCYSMGAALAGWLNKHR